MEIKSRHHLRSDAVSEIQESLDETLGVDIDADSFEKIELTTDEWDVVLVDGDPLVLYIEDEPFLTVRGANTYPPSRRIVTVDTGAIEFVSNGADIMRPGIVEADQAIDSDDLVVIDEEAHGKFLAIGRAVVEGEDMIGDEGRVVDSIHHVGDELFELQV